MIRKLTGLSLAAGVLLLGACHEDGTLEPPATPTGGALMSHYVAMGNSITAGYQSAGINDSTQRQSYAHLLAVASGAPYYYQSLRGRGCAPPFIKNAASPQTRVGAGTAATCDLVAPAEHPWLTNVAVPGARAIEMTSNFASPTASNALTTIILGGETQAQRMAEGGGPTLVTMWAGNNDVLGALTNSSNPGLPAAITLQANFNTAYDAALDAITATGAEALVVGVVDVTNIPYTSTGTTIWCAKTGLCGVPAAAFPATFTVNNNCAPNAAVPGSKGDSILVPWSTFVPLIGAAAGGAATALDCSVDTKVVIPSEYAALRDAVVGFNAHIVTAAAAHGFAYWDPNPTLLAKKTAGQIPLFPDLSQLATGVVTFGPYITLDGVHPSALAHKLIADSIAAHLNSAFGTTIPIPVAP
jgi:lysophospholipase L1-like esterase